MSSLPHNVETIQRTNPTNSNKPAFRLTNPIMRQTNETIYKGTNLIKRQTFQATLLLEVIVFLSQMYFSGAFSR